jgi:hypothetical protein
MLLQRLQQELRRRPLEEHGRGADAHREEKEAAKPKGEGEGRAAEEDVVGLRLQHVFREAIADRQDIAVKVHRPLGEASRAGGEGDDRDIVMGRDDVGEIRQLRRHLLLELAGRATAEDEHALERRRILDRRLKFVA